MSPTDPAQNCRLVEWSECLLSIIISCAEQKSKTVSQQQLNICIKFGVKLKTHPQE